MSPARGGAAEVGMRCFAWLVLGALALAAAPAGAQSQCAAAKLKASGAYVAGFAKCLSKGLAKAVSPDPLCVAKAQTKLGSGFARAERKDDCRTFGDASPVQDVLDDGIPELLEVVDPPLPTCCDVPGAACGWTADVADCTAAGGVAGAAGSVCNGSGACVAPDAAAPAFCCQTPILPPELVGTCYGGPLASIGCDQAGQELFESALCHPALGCVPAGEGPRSRCSAAKLKAAGAFFAGRAKCEAKAAAKGVPADVLCIGKAQSKLQRAFEKAEKKGDCLATGDLSDAAQEVNGTLDVLFQILEPPPSTCCALAGPPRCLWVADQAECDSLAGSFGAPGSVCGGDGACAPPPAPEGDCCEDLGGEPCLGGVSSADCGGGGGTFVGDAVCLPGGLCID